MPRQNPQNIDVKSTYNFVPAPLESEVFTPKWADQVSQDIPFSDGESGEIEFTITAKSPIFIRNGYSKGGESNEFSHGIVNGEKKYFIPATSIKGMTRNVLEIITHARMKQVNDHRHSVRQIMKNKVVDEGYDLSGPEKKQIRAGWLIEQNNEFETEIVEDYEEKLEKLKMNIRTKEDVLNEMEILRSLPQERANLEP